ncbi:Flp family type IVb pilin [Arthrobacter crusticola]|uniref:Flp family type IVb pilin n=1 Tax=Arthrobacter crusticola TaxID=2547960 RepID=A0A4R5TX17_9MICC|nr:Flp family type IVb pilin [Arthrobacter crusticola]TDK25721.1 Flp family type IVb pilin [Arthrobacter crusticola]
MLALFATVSTVLHTAKARLANEEKGATMVEYGLMVALIAVVVAVGALTLGETVRDLFTNLDFTPEGNAG